MIPEIGERGGQGGENFANGRARDLDFLLPAGVLAEGGGDQNFRP